MREGLDCPVCQSGTRRPIIYGLRTDEELQEKADRGEIVLGGCAVNEDSPNWVLR